MNIEEKAKEVLRLLQSPQTMDPVANDIAQAHNIALLVSAMRWAMAAVVERDREFRENQ